MPPYPNSKKARRAKKASPAGTLVCTQLVQGLKVGGDGHAAHHAPHVAGARAVGGHHQRGVGGHRQAAHAGAHLGHQLAAAGVGRQVPHADVAVLVACTGTKTREVSSEVIGSR